MPDTSVTRQATVPGGAVRDTAPLYVDSDDNRLKCISAGSGTTEVTLQESGGAASQSILTAASTLTAADSGKTFYLALSTGFTVALPAPAVGLRFRFFVQVAPVTSYFVTATNLAALVFSSISGDAESRTAFTGVNIEFGGTDSTIGDSADFWSDGTNWYCHAFPDANSGIVIN